MFVFVAPVPSPGHVHFGYLMITVCFWPPLFAQVSTQYIRHSIENQYWNTDPRKHRHKDTKPTRYLNPETQRRQKTRELKRGAEKPQKTNGQKRKHTQTKETPRRDNTEPQRHGSPKTHKRKDGESNWHWAIETSTHTDTHTDRQTHRHTHSASRKHGKPRP